MKLVFAILALAVCAVALPYADEIIKEINTDSSLHWKAGHNKFSSYSMADLKGMMGTSYSFTPDHVEAKVEAGKISLPDSFDVRQQWPGCATKILDQGKCGSCWAFGATEALSDRFCIQYNMSVQLSPQDPVSCDGYDMGCNGGNPENVWGYLQSTGAVDLNCFPYTSGAAGDVPQCPSSCPGTGQWDKYMCGSFKHIYKLEFWETAKAIQEELLQHGSVSAAFKVYEDFIHYTSGVYEHKSGQELGGHMVKIIGWGVESGTDYWLVANSWGVDWGENGLFKIKRSGIMDECGIQASVYGGSAKK